MLEGIQFGANDIVLLEASASELLIMDGNLPLKTLYARYNRLAKANNKGAVAHFTGFVRQEGEMNKTDGLVFELYEPLLVQWFSAHKERLESDNVFVCMAHSRGFVPVGKSSFSVCLIAKQRASVLNELANFVEDFKQNAPIWKYDSIAGQQIFERTRAKPLQGSGLFGDKPAER
ncbi:MAG: molybdenum cofactor biosynthesis protein MoaE [Helicobacter sp.]|nr:molybdenum cofactor biosynthesis protein MoaE [Helicobacter sp.]